jgi:colanic acid/amylovoran biosynthesis protein
MNATTKRKHILLTGTYCSLNKGDRLMQEVVIGAVAKHSLVDGVTLATPFPDIDKHCYPTSDKVKAQRRNLPLCILQVVILSLFPKAARQKLSSMSEELTAYRNADMVIDLSGDMLTEDYGYLVAVSHAIPLLLAVIYRKPLYIIGQSIGPFHKLKRLYRFVLKRAVVITARDSITQQYLTEMGLKNHLLSADLAFLAPPVKVSRMPDYLTNPDQKVIALCPSSLLLKKFSNVGYSFYKNLTNALVAWSRENACKLVLISHVENSKPKFSDSELCRRIVQDLDLKLDIIGEDLGPMEIKWAISKLNALISFRMHPCIAAMDCQVPVIGIGYSHKTTGVFELMGLGEWVLDSRELEIKQVLDELDRLLAHEQEIRERLKTKVPSLRQSAQKNIDVILNGISQ